LFLPAVAAALSLWPSQVDAHVRWFIDAERYPPEWERLFTWPALLVVVVSAVLLGGLLVLRRIVRTPHFPNPSFLAYMEPSATALLAVQTGISLVFFASQVDLFVPNLELDGPAAWILVTLQVAVAGAFITGLVDRGGAALVVAVWLLGFMIFAPWEMVDQTLYAGIGIALFVLGRTIPPPAVARRLLPLGDYERQSVAALRILAGVSFVSVAFTEKLLAPDAGVAFLEQYPEFNVMREFFGWSWWTDERFTIAAGVVEATAGILLISGVLTRVVILLLLVPFNVTVAFLPPQELLGHLPIFGIMYVLLLYGSGAEPRARERRLAPALAGDTHERERRMRHGDTPDDRPARPPNMRVKSVGR
jgi:uncharacterized membrane protein YphA (DoxX/SURF4 family)